MNTESELARAQESYVFLVAMVLKTLRLGKLGKTVSGVNRLFEVLSDIFYMHRVLLKNLLSWMFASLKLIIAMHYFASYPMGAT